MATEKIKSRIQLKYDTLENWNKATNFIPYEGEICVYSDIPSLKVGDGETKINDLPFMGDELITEKEIRSLFKTLIKFYVDGQEFTCEEGMTWQNFVTSKYNKDLVFSLAASGGSASDIFYGTQPIKIGNSRLSRTDVIIPNQTYSLGVAEPF